jgi:hypothetical protein
MSLSGIGTTAYNVRDSILLIHSRWSYIIITTPFDVRISRRPQGFVKLLNTEIKTYNEPPSSSRCCLINPVTQIRRLNMYKILNSTHKNATFYKFTLNKYYNYLFNLIK